MKRKLKAQDQPVLSIFPTLSVRQAHILMQCIALGMTDGVVVDGEYVNSDQWEELIRQLIRK